jgi:hypothetical protein
MPWKMPAACGLRACRLRLKKSTRRCTGRNDFVGRKQRRNEKLGISPAKAQACPEPRRRGRKEIKHPNLASCREQFLSCTLGAGKFCARAKILSIAVHTSSREKHRG